EPAEAPPRKSFNPSSRLDQIVGSDRSRLMMPPAATAPAPIYNTYAPRMSSGDIPLIGVVPGASAVVIPDPKNLIAGIRTRYASTPPAHIVDAIRGPMM